MLSCSLISRLLFIVSVAVTNGFHTPFHKISGFYGLIGPNIRTSSVNSLFELFTGDGIIQGVFLNRGNISFVKHLIQTDKVVYESKHGPFLKPVQFLPFYMIAHKLRMIPNVLGLANTALLKVRGQLFALFERDYPYEIRLDHDSREIHTVSKRVVPCLQTFSGHSKYDGTYIHSMDYNVLLKRVRYLQMFGDLSPTTVVKDIPMRYLPIIHDFAVLHRGVLLIDSPIEWNPFKRIPVSLNRRRPTYIHIYNWTTDKTSTYELPESVYLFHYANVLEYGNGTIEIYGVFYDTLDFSSVNIVGKYRKIVVCEGRREVSMERIDAFENMNLDFPKRWGRYTILQKNENRRFSGFLVCEKDRVLQDIRLPEDRSFCGEPEVVEIEGRGYLLGFSYDGEDRGYLVLCGLFEGDYFEVPLNETVTIGFHSTFVGSQ